MFLSLKITLPIIRNGELQKLTLRKKDVMSVLEYTAEQCLVRVADHVLPKHYDEHLRVALPHDKCVRMLRLRWR